MSDESLPKLRICVDEYLEGARFDPQELPDFVNPRATGREELALAKYKMWEVGQTLRIRFLDGGKKLHQRVEEAARQWLKYANLQFEFGNYPDAEIRVTFHGDGYRSLLGTEATLCRAPWPTMTLDGFNENTDSVELTGTVLHEFGHALGCVHEQASPKAHIPWNKDRVYKYYEQYYRWNKEKVDYNLFLRYPEGEVETTEGHDPLSIMQYPVPRELTIGGYEIGWNNDLSEQDKIFIAKMYPR